MSRSRLGRKRRYGDDRRLKAFLGLVGVRLSVLRRPFLPTLTLSGLRLDSLLGPRKIEVANFLVEKYLFIPHPTICFLFVSANIQNLVFLSRTFSY